MALGTLDASATTMTWVLSSSFVRAGAIDVALLATLRLPATASP